jgi:hypothetical protein
MNDIHRSADDFLRELRAEAIHSLREAYEDVYHLSKLSLTTLNKRRDDSTKYQSINEYKRELLARASAIGNFAVNLGILKPDDQLDAMYEFCDNHPELAPKGWIPGQQRSALHQRRGLEPDETS